MKECCGADMSDRIADLETKLAKLQTELAELRGVHRQMVNGLRDIGDKLIEDTVG